MRILFFVILTILTTSFGTNVIAQPNINTQKQVNPIIVDTVDGKKESLDSLSKNVILVDTTYLVQINQHTKETAENTQKGEREKQWAFPLSIAAFFIGIITLFFAILTFFSQRKTRKNTEPLFSQEQQYDVLDNILRSLNEALWLCYMDCYRLKKTESGHIPSDMLFPLIKFDPNEIHLELFYEKIVIKGKPKPWERWSKRSNYTTMSDLKKNIISFNENGDIIARLVQSNLFDAKTIEKLYFHYVLEEGIFSLLKEVCGILNNEKIFKKIKRKRIKRSQKEDLAAMVFACFLYETGLPEEKLDSSYQAHLQFMQTLNNSQIDELKMDKLNNYPGLDELVEDTKDKWKELLKEGDDSSNNDVDIAQAVYSLLFNNSSLPKAKNALGIINLDRFLDYVKITLACKMDKDIESKNPKIECPVR